MSDTIEKANMIHWLIMRRNHLRKEAKRAINGENYLYAAVCDAQIK